MIVCLKSVSLRAEPTQITLHLSERLPSHIISDCTLDCHYVVQRLPDYYILSLDVSGSITIQCQRCLASFDYAYVNHTEIVVCRDEQTAEIMMDKYECVVSPTLEVDLAAIVTDELHLYAPEKHSELIECTGDFDSSL
jgi:uncharacterized protein